MAFDGIVIANIVSDLKKALVGGRISKIIQPEPDELIITVKNRDTFRLRLSANASLPLVYLTQSNPLAPMTAPNFCMLLRKHIGNARILDISQPGLERVVRIDLEHLDEMGDLRRKSLNIEIMGKHSNIIFCDGCRIIDSIKHVSQAVSSVREVLPGREYFIPNTQNKHNPLTVSREEFLALFSETADAASALTKLFTGISRVSAFELVHRSGIDPDLPVNLLSEDDRLRLADCFLHEMEQISHGLFEPCIVYRGEEPEEFASLLLTGYTDCRLLPFSSISEVLESYYAQKDLVTRMRQKSAQLRKLVQNAAERTAKKYDLQLRQLEDTKKREKYRIYGELLNTYGYECPAEAKSFEVINYYTGEPLTIPLDPTLSPAENAKKYFDRYNKLKRTFEALQELIVETKAELDHLESVSTSIDLSVNDTDLDEIRRELVSCGYAKPAGSQKGKKDNRQKSQPYHYVSSDGFDIYVGRNNLQNDFLTFKLAQGNDIWMHAKKAHGSHVIIRTEGKEVPDRTYEEAGGLAAYYSQSRQAPKVEIDYIEKKFVKKPAGAKPGFVIYHTNYSLIAAPSADLRQLN